MVMMVNSVKWLYMIGYGNRPPVFYKYMCLYIYMSSVCMHGYHHLRLLKFPNRPTSKVVSQAYLLYTVSQQTLGFLDLPFLQGSTFYKAEILREKMKWCNIIMVLFILLFPFHFILNFGGRAFSYFPYWAISSSYHISDSSSTPKRVINAFTFYLSPSPPLSLSLSQLHFLLLSQRIG